MPPPQDPRRRARDFALQMLYQWEVGREDLPDVFVTFPQVQLDRLDPEHDLFARALVQSVVTRLGEIDPLIAAHAEHWRVERMAVIDRLILRLAIAEWLQWPETPPVVVINEAIELARRYSGEPAVKFVNGVLDAVRRDRESARRE